MMMMIVVMIGMILGPPSPICFIEYEYARVDNNIFIITFFFQSFIAISISFRGGRGSIIYRAHSILSRENAGEILKIRFVFLTRSVVFVLCLFCCCYERRFKLPSRRGNHFSAGMTTPISRLSKQVDHRHPEYIKRLRRKFV